MRVKTDAVFLLCLLAFAVANANSACGPSTPRCDSTVCRGCCAVDGTCMSGTETSACGSDGVACENCNSSNKVCILSRCVTRPIPGGDGGDQDSGPVSDAGGQDGGGRDGGSQDGGGRDGGYDGGITPCSIGEIRTNASLLGAVCSVSNVVVTFITSRAYDGGTYRHDFWVQDRTPGPNTGLAVFCDQYQGVPYGLVNEGSVVNVVGQVGTAPTSAGNPGGRLQLTGYGAATMQVSVIGSTTPPAAVQRSGIQVQPNTYSSPEYLGQKVRIPGTLYATDGRPPLLQRSTTAWNGFALVNGTLVDDLYTYALGSCNYGAQLRDAGTPILLGNGVVGIWDTYLPNAIADAGMIHVLWPFRCDHFSGGE